MQKLINALAVTSFVVSSAVVGSGIYVYVQRDSIVEKIRSEVVDSVKELLGTSQLGSVLVSGIDEEVDVTDEALGGNVTQIDLPVSPF